MNKKCWGDVFFEIHWNNSFIIKNILININHLLLIINKNNIKIKTIKIIIIFFFFFIVTIVNFIVVV